MQLSPGTGSMGQPCWPFPARLSRHISLEDVTPTLTHHGMHSWDSVTRLQRLNHTGLESRQERPGEQLAVRAAVLSPLT